MLCVVGVSKPKSLHSLMFLSVSFRLRASRGGCEAAEVVAAAMQALAAGVTRALLARVSAMHGLAAVAQQVVASAGRRFCSGSNVWVGKEGAAVL